MLTKKEAGAWAKDACENGTYPYKQAYRHKFGIGEIAHYNWDEPLFILGIEYGIKIAVAKIFGELDE